MLGVSETNERGFAGVWYDHIMLFNESGEGLLLDDSGPPEVVITAPKPGTTAQEQEEIMILFSEEVQGVKASDLLVNGETADAVTSQDNRRYRFSGFPEPVFQDVNEPGEYEVSVEVLPGTITSTSGEPFTGYSFSYLTYVFVEQPIIAFADFETEDHGWFPEEHAHDLIWVDG